MTALLSGVTVLDLSSLLPGPLATWHLASLGATVVKVESPSRGDYTRAIGPTKGETSFLYDLLNEGKEILPLELTDADDRAVFLERLSRSDLVVESFRPGVLERLGLGFARRTRGPAWSRSPATGERELWRGVPGTMSIIWRFRVG